jgi:nucleoside phosphorylase
LNATSHKDDAVIQPRKGKNDPTIGPDVLIALIGQDLARLSKLKPMEAFDQGFFKIFRAKGQAGADFSLAGPIIGAPQAVMVMEKLIALGARRIFAFGWCGSLQPNLRRKPRTDPGLNLILERALAQEGLPFCKGMVWTTDAPYRETASKIKAYREKRVLAVEMEMSALMALALYRSVEMAGLLVVSDELFDLKWHRGFSSPLFKQRCQAAGNLLIRLLENEA